MYFDLKFDSSLVHPEVDNKSVLAQLSGNKPLSESLFKVLVV